MTAPDLARGIRDREMKVQSIQTEGAAQTQNFVRLLSLELAIAAGQSQANRIQTADRTKQASRTGLVFLCPIPQGLFEILTRSQTQNGNLHCLTS